MNGPGKGGEVGDALMSDPRVRRVSFTGSTSVGRRLAEQAGRYLKRITLELGGKDAFIVLADADIDYAVSAAVFGRFLHQGQICMKSKRFILEAAHRRGIHRQFIERVRGSRPVTHPARPPPSAR